MIFVTGRNETLSWNLGQRVMKIMTVDVSPVMKTMTRCHENHDGMDRFWPPPVIKIMTSLIYHPVVRVRTA